MPFTTDIDENFSITVKPAAKDGPRRYTAEATIYDRRTQKRLGVASGTGATSSSAEQDAYNKAKTDALQVTVGANNHHRRRDSHV